MRYRIKEYYVEKTSEYLQVTFIAPAKFVSTLNTVVGSDVLLNDSSKSKVIEAIRLVTNETRGGYVICSTGQKEVVSRVWKNVEVENDLRIEFSIDTLIAAANGRASDIAAIEAMTEVDMYTIEMDFGEAPSDIASGGGITMMTAAEYAPALSALSDAIDALDEEDDEEESVES